MIIPIPIYYDSGGSNIPINWFTSGLLILFYLIMLVVNIKLLVYSIKNKMYILALTEIIIIIIALLPLSLLFN